MSDLRAALRPGDVLLYRGTGLYGLIIRFHTGHKEGHVEVYAGLGLSVASRNGIGVNTYPLRHNDLCLVCRPKPEYPFRLGKALAWHAKQIGTPYGWFELLEFIGYDVKAHGVVCSAYATEFLRAGGIDPFNGEDAQRVAPYEFTVSNVFDIYEVQSNGTLSRRGGQVAAATS